MIKIMIVVGARPNFMKAAPLMVAIRERNRKETELSAKNVATGSQTIQPILVHTGQHYDQAMSETFFKDLELQEPDVYLGVGSASHAAQTAEIMTRFEAVLLRERPDIVVVVGDVNSTLACALTAAKISYDSHGGRPLIAHVEAGLRSFDRAMPEEVNRIVTDHLSDFLFVTEESGTQNLLQEGIEAHKIHFVGNTMIDSLLACKEKAGKSSILDRLGLRNGSGDAAPNNGANRYALLTLHRPSNVDDRTKFLSILQGLEELSQTCPIVFSAHPRTRKRITEFGLEHFVQIQNGDHADGGAGVDPIERGIRLLEPLGYLDFLCLMEHAALVVTDSGGIQDETTSLGVPCVTVRDNTERPVTVTCGTNTVAGTQTENIVAAIKAKGNGHTDRRVPEKWDGKAAGRIIDVVVAELQTLRLQN